jgi:hypothetical protein
MVDSLADSAPWAKDTLMDVRLCKPELFGYTKTFVLQ